jgi:hypothetical protein
MERLADFASRSWLEFAVRNTIQWEKTFQNMEKQRIFGKLLYMPPLWKNFLYKKHLTT